jgi:hypothetical protein
VGGSRKIKAISNLGTIVASAIGVAIALGVGVALHKANKERNEKRAVVSVVTDTTSQLRSSLKTPAPGALEKIEGNLRVAKAWSNPELSDATEHYLLGAREILRRRTEADRLAQKAAAGRAALAAHMRNAGNRGTGWFHTASDLKKRVERDHFDLDMQLKALADLLDSLPEANKRLEPHVQTTLLLEDNIRKQARLAVLAEAKQAAAELQKVRNLAR